MRVLTLVVGSLIVASLAAVCAWRSSVRGAFSALGWRSLLLRFSGWRDARWRQVRRRREGKSLAPHISHLSDFISPAFITGSLLLNSTKQAAELHTGCEELGGGQGEGAHVTIDSPVQRSRSYPSWL